jgi:hypothetical protein
MGGKNMSRHDDRLFYMLVASVLAWLAGMLIVVASICG